MKILWKQIFEDIFAFVKQHNLQSFTSSLKIAVEVWYVTKKKWDSFAMISVHPHKPQNVFHEVQANSSFRLRTEESKVLQTYMWD